jgi:LDH2 family malate/lactate/ureidoglycolate dehydrogenase
MSMWRVQALLARVKGAKKLPGVEDIYLPGERSEALAAEVQARGSIALEKKMWEGLQELYRATGGEEAALS